MSLKSALEYSKKHQGEFQKTLSEFLSIPSISSDPNRVSSMLRAATWLKDKLTELGLDKVKVHQPKSSAGRSRGSNEGKGGKMKPHPVITAEKIFSPDYPTVLMYSHYDVQPVGEIAEEADTGAFPEDWKYHPFKPEVVKGRIYARGSSDNKGPLIMQLMALKSLIETQTPMVNVKVILEGEEEVGSRHTYEFLEKNKALLRSDLVLVTDTEILDPKQGSITLGVRGLAFFNCKISAASRDLHSGMYGGAVPNPALELMRLISSLSEKDPRGRFKIKGFYDGINPRISSLNKLSQFKLSQFDKTMLKKLTQYKDQIIKETGLSGLKKISTEDLLGKIYYQPTLDVNGFETGDLGKTIIPSSARASFSLRLVDGQDYKKVIQAVKDHLKAKLNPGFKLEFLEQVGGNAVSSNPEHPGVVKAFKALEKSFPEKPVFLRTGGSIPILAAIKNTLRETTPGAELVMVGFTHSSDRIHANNESFSLKVFQRGIDALIRFLSLSN